MINASDHADLHGGDQVVAEVGRQQLGVELEGGGPNLLDPGVTRHTRAVHVQYTCSTRAVHVQYTWGTGYLLWGRRRCSSSGFRVIGTI